MLSPFTLSHIRNDINVRNINKILHFTNAKNLNSILKNGLQSINLLQSGGKEYFFNDSSRYDNRHDYISLSISFPNNKMFYKCRTEHPNEQFIVLEISPDVILSKNCLFFYTNAACSEFNNKSEHLYQTTDAWDSLFAIENRKAALPDHYTTDVQAELMIKGIIEPQFIQKIHFSGIKDPNLLLNKEYINHSDMFSYRKEDYI